ncbi:hypothetical protein [Chromobacterium haemolyticum]|uniref:hypothetical protein n=1 Tax=Chromobacterium haemolyticum TaxID=394935 RepID=UPI0013188185|nr:hypothetical protein [Chromobacterium haemolyticum]BBH12911.1 hypothetical protein CH06BL_21590 [Chromobacterium haemolyticum]
MDINDDLLVVGERTHEFTLKHYVTGQDTKVKIQVFSIESEQAQQLQRKLHDDDVARLSAANAAGRERADPLSYLEREQLIVSVAVARTAGWSGLTEDGSPFAFTPQNAQRLYSKAAWIRDAVISESANLGKFLPPPAVPSEPTQNRNSDSTSG